MAQNYYKKLITRKEAADILSCSTKHIYRLDRRGTLLRHPLPDSKRPRYLKSDVLDLIES